MNNPLKISLLAAAFATVGAGAALADSPEVYQQLAAGRRLAEQSQTRTTIAVYAHGRGVGRERVMREQQPEQRVEIRNNGRGQTFSVYRPAE